MNIWTAVVALLLCAAVVLVILKMINDKKKGKGGCGCGCSGCAMSGMCHQEKKDD